MLYIIQQLIYLLLLINYLIIINLLFNYYYSIIQFLHPQVQYKNLHPRESRHKGWHTLDEDINSNTRHHEVVGLHPGSTYKFRVVGVYSNNDNKQGPNSARFTLAMQGVKHLEPPVECPVIVGARPLSATEIRIEWQVRAGFYTRENVRYFISTCSHLC